MWCDNCLLLLPLRTGAMAWAVVIFVYSLAGGLFMLLDGHYFFFLYPEWYIYGGIGIGVAVLALLNAIALSNRSYIWTRACKFLWIFVIIISAVRATLIIVQLQRGKDKIIWECNHGGQVWTSNAEYAAKSSFPVGFCSAGFNSLNTAFIISLLVDLVFQMYMFFLDWRYQRRLERYDLVKTSSGE
ncbi:hypothetical protein BDM02DRAFT_3106778 [Thelephora ganbajun]|uniref:Uncharacterized protein n=1 Tax=Thelephora ganbajun TaxID=370292 RepID=A0ACB6ZXZ4_THEGA|nr:hypothetical protein BDM02DRAFT_3106778 [Thelephora ganbajun]